MKSKQHIDSLLSVDKAKKFMNFVNKNTYFIYEDERYRQVKGLAMGAPSSGAIATLFLGWEAKAWLQGYGGAHLLTYFRYIDDIFFMFKGTRTELDAFLERMSFTGLKLTFSISRNYWIFLDTVIQKDFLWVQAYTRLYAKSGNTHMYVP